MCENMVFSGVVPFKRNDGLSGLQLLWLLEAGPEGTEQDQHTPDACTIAKWTYD